MVDNWRKLNKPNEHLMHDFFGGEGNDLSNDHHNSIENVIKNFSFFWAFMDMASSSLLGHHAQCLHNILPASAFQTIYANWLRQSVPKRSGKKCWFCFKYVVLHLISVCCIMIYVGTYFSTGFPFCAIHMYWCQRPVCCSASAFPARFAVDFIPCFLYDNF